MPDIILVNMYEAKAKAKGSSVVQHRIVKNPRKTIKVILK